MILVVGGFAQGKLAFAKAQLGVCRYGDGQFTDDNCIYNLQKLVMELEFEQHLDIYLEKHPEAVLICDEVGCGIVPMSKEERDYREKTGRICCKLAADATEVYRVICGIGTRLK